MWKCKKCNTEVEDQFDACWNCGNENNEKKPQSNEKQTAEMPAKKPIANRQIQASSNTKYPALKTTVLLFKALAIIVGIATIFCTIFCLTEADSILFGLVSFITGSFLILVLIAIAESIKVIVDIEFNTRQTSNRQSTD